MKQPYLECGKIVGTHGVRGQVRIESWCDSPSVITQLPAIHLKKQDGNFEAKRILRAFVGRGQAILQLEEVADMESAIALKGTVVWAKREDVPLEEGDHFIADLLGLPVIDADTGRIYGEIAEVSQLPASDVYTVKTSHGNVLFPAVPEYVTKTDLESGVYIRPIPGFFEEEPS